MLFNLLTKLIFFSKQVAMLFKNCHKNPSPIRTMQHMILVISKEEFFSTILFQLRSSFKKFRFCKRKRKRTRKRKTKRNRKLKRKHNRENKGNINVNVIAKCLPHRLHCSYEVGSRNFDYNGFRNRNHIVIIMINLTCSFQKLLQKPLFSCVDN